MVSAKGADYDLLLDMRRATRRAHSIANALILSKLVVALTDRKLYARALSTFLPVYEALEAAMHTATDVPGLKQLTAIAQRIPSRAAALEQVRLLLRVCMCHMCAVFHVFCVRTCV